LEQTAPSQAPSQEPSLAPSDNTADAPTNGSDVFNDAVSLANSLMGNETSEPAAVVEKTPVAVESPKAAPSIIEQALVTEKQEQKDNKSSSKLAALHKRDKELFQREQALKEREAHYQKMEATLNAMKEDPAHLLEAAGFKDLNELLERFADDGGRLSPERRQLKELQKKLESFEAEKSQLAARQQEETVSRQRQQAIDNVNGEIVQFLKTNEIKYPLLSMDGSKDLVFKKLQDHYRKTEEETGSGQALTLEKAAEMANSEAESIVRMILGNSRALELAKEILETKSNVKPGAASVKQPIKTITNEARSSVGVKNNKSKTSNELFEEAQEMLRRSLNARR